MKVLMAVSQVWGLLVVKKRKKPMKTMLMFLTLVKLLRAVLQMGKAGGLEEAD